MTFIPRDDLERLEGCHIDEPCWKVRMWRRSYCVALTAIAVLEARIARLNREQFDAPMKFFYPPTENRP